LGDPVPKPRPLVTTEESGELSTDAAARIASHLSS
jgi:hypothetical protein